MGVEFFDLVLGWCGCCSVRCSRSNDFDFHQCFCQGFGVDISLFIEGLRVGVNGEEGTACGDSGDEGAGSAFVPFKVSRIVGVIGLIHLIGDSSDFHDFTREDVLISRKNFITASVAPCGTGRPTHVADVVDDHGGSGIDGVAPEPHGVRGVG